MEQSLVIKEFQDFNITIFGTYETPLFKAKDIGDLLGIEKIRDTVVKLDDQWFLTEDGLFEVLCISRKPIAKQFRIKVREILKEIRLTGKYPKSSKLEFASLTFLFYFLI
jgi:anti-repressor protein